MKGKKVKIIEVMVLIILIFLFCNFGNCNDTVQVKVEPANLLLGTFYQGSDMKVAGVVPANSDVVVRFIGIKKDLHLKKKGKVLGLLWMNLDSFTFRGVPNVCLIYSNKQLAVSSDGNEAVEDDAWKLSLSSLERQITVEPASKDRTSLIKELVKMKKLENLYIEDHQGVKVKPKSGNRGVFEAHVRVPSSLTPGKYVVEVYALQAGTIIGSKIIPIEAKLVGLPAFLYKMAFDHSLLYGLLATIVAVLGGLLMGVIFGTGKGAH